MDAKFTNNAPVRIPKLAELGPVLARALGGAVGRDLVFDVWFKPDERRVFRAAIVTLVGPRPATICVSMDPPSATSIASGLFQCGQAEVDAPMIDETSGELANIAGGVVKGALNLSQALSTPALRKLDRPFLGEGETARHCAFRADDAAILVSVSTDPTLHQEFGGKG